MSRAVFLLAFCAGVCQGFFLGGSDKNGIGIPVQLGDKPGFMQDQSVYSHLVIPPWSRPFKPGYCTSWEWNTDKRYREQRLAICNDLAKGKHECDSPSGFCKDKCPYTNGSYPYWRIRNAADVPFLWVIGSLQMYDTPFSNKPLTVDPQRAYGSSYFGPGYKPSNAFDNNPDTLWISNGGAPPGMQWIAYEFENPVFIGSIRIALEEEKPDRSPSMMYVEASCEKYFKNFATTWVITNPKLEADKRFSVFGQAKFTSLGASGRLGPVSLGSHYKGQDHEGQVSVNKGVQMWKVPATGTYSIEAAGAAGGYDKFSGASKFRGRGARVKGNFKLKKGDILKVLIGQEGQSNPTSGGAGGGGGSFVIKQDNSPVIIAGGGGGVDKMKSESPRCHGSISQDGNPGFGGSMFIGGSGGRGAEEGDNGYSGGGGGGLKTNGRNNKNFGGPKGTGGQGGKAFTSGGVGGRSNQNHVDGGFGGGGGPNGAGGGGGGGGGYSGGASGSRSNSCGGGGGSFNTGTDQLSKPGANTGHGYVVIKLVSFK